MNIFKWIIVLLLSLFFLLAGVLKLVDPVEFARAILRYRIINEQMAWIAALWIPWTEVVIAVALLKAYWRRAACWLSLVILGVFEIALVSAYMRGLDIDCGCFGTNADSSVSFSIVRNLVIMAIIGLLMKIDQFEGEKKRSTGFRG